MTTATRSRHGDAYSAIWTVANCDDLVREVEGQFESWLRHKGAWDPPTETTGYHVGPAGQELLVVHRDAAEGKSLRYRLTENTDRGTWRTSVTVSEGHGSLDTWVGLRVSNSEGVAAKVPHLASYLLEALELRDGETWLSPAPQRVSSSEVERVAEEVTDPLRQGLYLVAGTDDSMPLEVFAHRVARWTHDTRGMAQVVVLDPRATRDFAEIVGRTHEVMPWTIRTFDTNVDPSVDSDGRRHRILGTRRLAGSDAAVRSILGHASRVHAARRPLPSTFTTVHRSLVRLEDQLLVASLAETVGPPGPGLVPEQREPDPKQSDSLAGSSAVSQVDEVAQYLAQVELVKEVLGLDAIGRNELSEIAHLADRGTSSAEAIDRVTRELEERREAIAELEFERDLVRELSDDQEVDLAEALSTQSKLSDENRWLRQQLVKRGQLDASFASLPDDETTKYPADFSELAEMLGGLKPRGVMFTGDLDVVVGLSDHDPVGRIAGVTWDCLLSICDYVRARADGNHSQGLRQYLETTPQGYRSVPRKKFAAKETAATMQAWGDQRSFPVPETVDPERQIVMEGHFKLGRVGMVSPRMYYHDNYSRDGVVYVGYIGSHLRNTQTN